MTSPLFLSDLKLPKELSKKKKLNLMFGTFIEDSEKLDTYNFEMNKEDQLVFFTVEGAIMHEVMNRVVPALSRDITVSELNEVTLINHGVMVLVDIEMSAQALNDKPIRVDVHNNALDPEFNDEDLCMHLSLINKDVSEFDMHISFIKIDSLDAKKDPNTGKMVVKNLKFHQVVHTS